MPAAPPPLQTILALNSDLCAQALDRIDDIVAHLRDARAFLARTFGTPPKFPAAHRPGSSGSITAMGRRALPSELRKTWDALSPDLADANARLGPTTDSAASLLPQEAYHLGQIGLLRRELGLPATRYPAASAT